MALTGTGDALGDEIRAQIDLVTGEIQAHTLDPTNTLVLRTAIYRAFGNAIINHLIANGLSAVAVVSVSGVTVGAGVSGPGTGNLV